MGYVVAAVLGYLAGTIPVAVLVARRYGVDLRRTGDGNPGAWNALEQLGGRRATPAFLGDGAKALVAGLAGHVLAGWWGALAGVAGAMIGHALPIWAGLRGGKAVMAFVGGGFALSPIAAALCLVLCGAISAGAGFKWGARAGVFAFPAIQLATDPVEHVMATGALMSLIGLLFVLKPDRSGRARSEPGAAPTS